MKNTIISALVMIGLSLTVFGQKSDPVTQDASYTVDFVFTGEIQSTGDSLFSLQYTFASQDVQKFKEFELEDSKGMHHLNLSVAGLQGNMEIRNEKDKVKVIVHQYDRYDLPVLIQAEDYLRVKHSLYLSTSQGRRITAEQLKVQLHGIHEPVKQIEQKRISETDQHK